MNLNLFKNGNFISSSGKELDWKIECDVLTDADIETLAKVISKRFIFSEVYGIPRGGERLAKALEKFIKPDACLLIVDDVLTTGNSMEDARKKFGRLYTLGVVIFARNECPSWITPIFQFNL